MSLFNFQMEEMLSFFAVLVRYSVMVAVLPFVGDKTIPAPVKILLALTLAITLFPALVSSGDVRPVEAARWGATAGGIAGTIALEALMGLALGYTARLVFDAINFGGNLVGTFMGFAMASTYDHHQETQTQVVSEVQMAIAMLLFLAIDGHHLMLRASLDSYRIIGVGGLGIGKGGFNALFSQKLIELTGDVVRFGLLIAAPVAVSLFAVNVAFGVMAKAMPQLHIFVLSLAVSALVGLIVLFLGMPAFQSAASSMLGRMGEWMDAVMAAMARGR